MDSIENGGRLVVGGVDALAVRRSDLRLTLTPSLVGFRLASSRGILIRSCKTSALRAKRRLP